MGRALAREAPFVVVGVVVAQDPERGGLPDGVLPAAKAQVGEQQAARGFIGESMGAAWLKAKGEAPVTLSTNNTVTGPRSQSANSTPAAKLTRCPR